MGRAIKFASVCSGIEAASVAWHPLGWQAALLSEIEPFPRRVLEHRQRAEDARRHRSGFGPALWGDFTTIRPRHLRRLGIDATIDLLVGGTPCQSFSVAGLRGGLDDSRGNLALEFLRLARRLRARWLVWENVPGVLSSNGGRDFGAILGGMAELGYGFAYRVLDAQHFGVPQRRRRVFVVGYLGDWRRAAAVLFERGSLFGDHSPRGKARKDTPGTLAGGARRRGGYSTDDVPLIASTLTASAGGQSGKDRPEGRLIAAYGGNNTSGPIDLATAINAHGGPHGRLDFESETFIAHTLRGEGFDASEDGTGRGIPLVPVAFSCKDYGADAGSTAPTLRAMGHENSHANAGGQIAAHTAAGVRRLTPRERERLQGLPDDYTLVPLANKRGRLNGKFAADGPRYKALGNSMAVPVMRWIGERIAAVDALDHQIMEAAQ